MKNGVMIATLFGITMGIIFTLIYWNIFANKAIAIAIGAMHIGPFALIGRCFFIKTKDENDENDENN